MIVDADEDVAQRWQSLRLLLKELHYPDAPETPDAHGTIIHADDKPTIGIWIMPDNTLPGTIEDFARALVPSSDRLWNRAVTCVDAIPTADRLFPEVSTMKARMHTWLAWQVEPGKPIGLAITKRYLDGKAPQARELVSWMERLFEHGSE
ncbi:MAG: DUF3226 domain-containing protein [Capsulimonadaceae bacterium]